MADQLLEALGKVGLRVGRGGEYLRTWCPFHPNPSGKTLWVSHETGRWGCFSRRCPQHAGGNLHLLLVLRGMSPPVAASVVRTLDLKQREQYDRPETLEDQDHIGKITEAHVAFWAVDWALASQVCARVLEVGSSAYVPGVPVSQWAQVPATPGQVEHDGWEYLWYLLVNRGLTPHGLDMADVGLDMERGLLVFPLRSPNGALMGVARREARDGADYVASGCVYCRGDDEYDPRVHFVPVRKGETLFGWSSMSERIAAGEPIVVVEGYADQIRLAGFGYCAVAKMGAKLTRHQLALLSEAPGPKILWPDCDPPGIDGCREDAAALAMVPNVRVVTYFGGVNDAGSRGVSAAIVGRVVASATAPALWLSRLPEVFAQIAAG
jgi:hypothetical protein